jgi:hypothetical protein
MGTFACLQSTLVVALAPPDANQAKQLSKLWSPMARHGKGSASNVLEVQFIHKCVKHTDCVVHKSMQHMNSILKNNVRMIM